MRVIGSTESGETTPPPAKTRPKLVGHVNAGLRTLISNDLKPGDRLPSEAALTARFGVSRTVVREAIAALRADGLVEPRQGAGVFILAPQPESSAPFSGVNSARISSIIEMLELRAAVEIEAAGLAAERRSPAQDEAIQERYDEIQARIMEGQPTTEADYGFHAAIADATNNPRFREFLELMGARAIPRASLAVTAKETELLSYLTQIQTEHRNISEAISARNSEGARAAMREHLLGSQTRYRHLLRGR